MKEITRQEFENSQQYLEYLKQQFDALQRDGFYNIYLHQIGRLDDDEIRSVGYQAAYESKIASFLGKGLKIDRYGSIGGTAKFTGQSDKVNLQEVLSYSFDKYVSHNAVAIFAIPKFIHFSGKTEEFSSFRGRARESALLKQHLSNLYKLGGLQLQPRDIKFCLYDAVKGTYMPNIFLLGIQEIDKKSKRITFVDGGTHMIYLSGDEKQNAEKLMAEFGAQIAKILGEGDGKISTALVEASKREEEKGLYETDFDI